LRQNGSFDPEKAAAVRQQAVAGFAARMRKSERLAWKYLIVLTALSVFAVARLLQQPDPRWLVLYGILLVIALEGVTVIKLWYWIVNTKLSVLKELKQLRLELPAAAASGRAADEGLLGPTPTIQSCSRTERALWWVAIVIVGGLVGVFAGPPAPPRPPLRSQGFVTLAADGSGTVVTRIEYVYHDVTPLTSFTFTCGSPPGAKIRWIDSRGRELPATVSQEGGQARFVVRLVEPVMPGERLAYTQILESPSLVTRDGDLWTYRQDWQYGYWENDYAETVILPAGAEAVSADPEPSGRFTRGGAPGLWFRGARGPQEHFRYTVRYLLAAESKPLP